MKTPRLEDYPLHSSDKLRFADTDQQGHVNNAIFATLCETGRVELMQGIGILNGRPHRTTVLARIRIDYLRSVFFPGTVQTGTGVIAIGSSSVTLAQAIFQKGECVATAESVAVQVDAKTGRSTPLDEAAKAALSRHIITL